MHKHEVFRAFFCLMIRKRVLINVQILFVDFKTPPSFFRKRRFERMQEIRSNKRDKIYPALCFGIISIWSASGLFRQPVADHPSALIDIASAHGHNEIALLRLFRYKPADLLETRDEMRTGQSVDDLA